MSRSSANFENEIENMMQSYYGYIGSAHIENMLAAIESEKESIRNIKISHELETWFEHYFKTLRKKENRRNFLAGSKRFAKSAVIFLVVIIMSLSVLTVTVEAFRTKLFNLFIETTDTHTTVRVEESSSADTEGEAWNNSYWPMYVPADFVLNSKEILNDTKLLIYNSDDAAITFAQGPNGTEFQLDTEMAKVSDVMINTSVGILAEKEDVNILFWSNEDASFYIISSIEPEEMIKFAKQVEKK